MPPRPTGHSLDTLVLTTLCDAAQAKPASYSQGAAAAALHIAQEPKMRGDPEFETLANDGCRLVYHVVTFIEQMKEQDITLPSEFENSIKDLFKVLKEIELFANKPQSYSFFIPFQVVMSYSDTSRILGYRQTLCHFWARFVGLQSNIVIRNAIAQIVQRQDAIIDILRQESMIRPPQPPIVFIGSIDSRHNTIIHDSGNQTTTSSIKIVNTNSGNLTAYHGETSA